MSEPGPSAGSAPGADSSESTASLSAADLQPNSDTRRCFVCLVDEPEKKLPRDWTTPCKCSLEGHHECLLDWIADLEAGQKPLQCPQCKGKVRVKDQYDPLVHLGDSLTKILSQWSPTILLSFVGSGALISSAFYGFEAIELFAGSDAAAQFLIKGPITHGSYGGYILQSSTPQINFTHFLFLPFIGPALILNRLNFGNIVAIPGSILVAAWPSDLRPHGLVWPPTAAQALYLYPALKSAYFHFYAKFFRKMEQRWERIARASRINDNTPDGDVAAAENGGGHGIQFQAELNFNLGGGGRLEENEINEEDNVGVAPQPVNAEQQGGGNGGPDAAGGGGNPGRGMIDLNNVSSPLNFITGALLYPAICYGAGEILRMILPPKMVTSPLRGPVTGLLQEQWGRSLVGGSLFVFLKDAFFLYVKYRRAMNRPMRKIQNVRDRNIGR